MAARRVQRFGIDRRLVELERRKVRCVACEAATSSFFRVLDDSDFDELVRTVVYRDICAECGHERPGSREDLPPVRHRGHLGLVT